VAAGVLVPLLAITGWVAAARRQFDALQQAAGPAGDGARVSGEQENLNRFILEALGQLEAWSQWAVLGLVALALSIMAARWAASRMRRKVRITYGDGTVVTCPPGMTILEISRSRGIPHMSVCGGRARCSTCRTLVRAEDGALTPPTEPEAALLRRLNADPGIRLGCQARVRSDIEVRPLIQPQAISAAIRQADPLGWGVEREVALLFLDIRGFSRISEKSLPYDVVFILNSLFAEVGAEIEAANGYIDKFMGDGLMAIFGLASTPAEAARDAVRAALAAQDAARHASRILTLHLPEPLRIGIGIHVGQAVIGRIGRTSDQTSPPRLTAIGDTVNIAARLEAATKELQAGVVISAKTLQTGGIEIREDIGERAEIMVHNISRLVDVVAIRDHSALRRELGFDARMPGETDRFRRRGSGNSIALVGGDGAADRG
jgi:adenylate cyclase